MMLTGRILVKGIAEGDAIVSRKRISFLGDIDPATGEVTDRNSDIHGENISGKILIFPGGKGSTVGSYVILRMKKNGTAPLAIINDVSEPIIAVGAVIAEIPLMDSLKDIDSGKRVNPSDVVSNGDHVHVNSIEGWVKIE